MHTQYWLQLKRLTKKKPIEIFNYKCEKLTKTPYMNHIKRSISNKKKANKTPPTQLYAIREIKGAKA